jgi:hypothetical protein
MKTLVFTVNQTLTIQMDGSWRLSSTNATITVPKDKLNRQPDGSYTLGLNADVSGSAGFSGCSKPFSDTSGITITVKLDPDDATKATLFVQIDDTGIIQVSIKCAGITTLLPVPLQLWAGSFTTPSGPVSVSVGTPTTVVGSGGSKGASTVVDLEQEAPQ